MTEFTTVLFVLIGVIVGFVAGRATSRAGDAKKLHNELTKARRDLSQYKREMGDHFTTSAGMLEQMDEQLQRLSQHMAEQSHKLLPAESNPFHPEAILQETPAEDVSHNTQPLDYSGQPSGLLSEKNRLA